MSGSEKPTLGCSEALWPAPARVVATDGFEPDIEVIDLCSGDGWFTLQIGKIVRHHRLRQTLMTLLIFGRQWISFFDGRAFHGIRDRLDFRGQCRRTLKPMGYLSIVN